MNTVLMTKMRRVLGRRAFLLGGAGGAVLIALRLRTHADQVSAATGGPVTIVKFTDAGARQDTVTLPKVVKSDDEWQKQLSPESYEVTRHAGTEAPGSGALLNEHDKGVFRCICCDNALYSSDTKFESGTGWPSFWTPIAEENVTKTEDASFGMVRIAVSCTLCDAHLGHVFDDGPQPTGLRYCMNSVAMRFAKAVA
ncbi:MAG TPA: peptide-methionine (R)-S-oxide reductase MsrB [Dongiaceae bacterium]|jgi:peptide-methionine (R)-S-oxide reductase|nr:peptide-methionine (R)-S-oxide reductase MsrB [Dongiaceae bacterium]